jgi:hypothetical protein
MSPLGGGGGGRRKEKESIEDPKSHVAENGNFSTNLLLFADFNSSETVFSASGKAGSFRNLHV